MVGELSSRVRTRLIKQQNTQVTCSNGEGGDRTICQFLLGPAGHQSNVVVSTQKVCGHVHEDSIIPQGLLGGGDCQYFDPFGCYVNKVLHKYLA